MKPDNSVTVCEFFLLVIEAHICCAAMNA